MDVIAILGLIAAIVVPVLIMLYQERKPRISVSCRLVSSGDPSAIECVVSNTGGRAVEDVRVGFSFMLLNETTIISLSDTSVNLVEIDIPIQMHNVETPDASIGVVFPPNLPNPNLQDSDANHARAFAIHISSVPAKTNVEFRLITKDNDNRRAARQVMYICENMIQTMRAFIDQVRQKTPQVVKKLRFQDFVSARAKLDCFYKPGYFSFSGGRKTITFLSKDEIKAMELMESVFKDHKGDYSDLFNKQPQFIAPVVRFRTDNGTSTSAVTPPFGTTVTLFVEKDDYQRMKMGEQVPLRIPRKYDCE